jgi:hypothetical protein
MKTPLTKATGGPHAIDTSLDLFGQIVDEIQADPIAFVQADRLDKIKALKLTMPNIILAHKVNRRYHYEKYESAKADVDLRRAEVELAVKDDKDPVTNKPLFRNREGREVEILRRLQADGVYRKAEAMRRAMYAQAKSLEDEIVYYEQIDQSLIEICAMMTAEIEFASRTGVTYGASLKTRSSRRAKDRSKDRVNTSYDQVSSLT